MIMYEKESHRNDQKGFDIHVTFLVRDFTDEFSSFRKRIHTCK